MKSFTAQFLLTGDRRCVSDCGHILWCRIKEEHCFWSFLVEAKDRKYMKSLTVLLFLLTPLTDGVCPIVDKFSDVGSKKREEYWQQTTDGKKLTLTQHKSVLVLVLCDREKLQKSEKHPNVSCLKY